MALDTHTVMICPAKSETAKTVVYPHTVVICPAKSDTSEVAVDIHTWGGGGGGGETWSPTFPRFFFLLCITDARDHIWHFWHCALMVCVLQTGLSAGFARPQCGIWHDGPSHIVTEAWDYIWHFWHCASLDCVLLRGPWTVCGGWQRLVLSQPPSVRGSARFGPWANSVHIVLSGQSLT